MIYYLIIGLCAVIFSIGLLLIQKPFFQFAISSTALLNAVLDDVSDEDTKQKLLIGRLGELLKNMFVFVLLFVLVIMVTLVPINYYSFYFGVDTAEFDTNSAYFYLAMVVGGLTPFFIPFKKQEGDYSDWSKLLHRMILEHPFLSKQLFSIERAFFLRSKPEETAPPVIVTGLARAGTTAMTQLLFRSGKFHSLSYANMPFLLAPNTWKIFYRPKNTVTKERAHGDNIEFGFETIEALEEQFFKAYTNNSFIKDSTLGIHEVDEKTHTNYRAYRRLVNTDKSDSIYLAKNNNLILRLKSLRTFDTDFRVLVVVRDPLQHAISLLKQHQRFSKLHEEDPFSLEYMNWLGHHEFGQNHKPFNLGVDKRGQFDLTDINYWIASWIEYYAYLNQFVADKYLYLVSYQELAQNPELLLDKISSTLNVELNGDNHQPYSSKPKTAERVNEELLKEANALYSALSASFM